MRGARMRAAHACVHRSANFLHVSSSTLHGLPEYTLHLCITSTPESGHIDKVATSKSHCFFYSFFTIRYIFSACRVKLPLKYSLFGSDSEKTLFEAEPPGRFLKEKNIPPIREFRPFGTCGYCGKKPKNSTIADHQ